MIRRFDHLFKHAILAGVACASVAQGAYTDYAFKKGYDTTAPQFSVASPQLNVGFYDNSYKTFLTQVTHVSQITDTVKPTWVRHEYSRRPAFNVDGTRMMAFTSNGWYRLYSVNKVNNTTSFVRTLPFGGSVEPNWHPTDPNLIYYIDQFGKGMKIYQYNISTNTSSTVRDYAAQVKAIFPTAAAAWTKEEGRPSDDGKIWCFQVENSSFGVLGLIAYDFANNKILGSMSTTVRPDHISTSPSGKYCVPSWAYNRELGTRAYTLDFSKNVMLHSMSEHSDLATSANGKDAYVFFDYDSGDLAMSEFGQNTAGALTATRTNLFRIYGANNSSVAGHVSGTAKNKPGYAVVSFYGCSENYGAAACSNSQWFKDKVVIVNLKSNFDATQDIYNLAHTNYASSGYFGETQAVASFDLSKVLFASSWGSTSESAVTSYMVDVPVQFLGGTTPPTQPPTNPVYKNCSFNGATVVHGANVTAYQAAVVPAGSVCVSQVRTCNDGVLSGTYAQATCRVDSPTAPAPFAVTLKSVVRTNPYSANVAVNTNNTAACRIAATSGNSYDSMYDNLTSSADKKAHTKTVSLSGSGQHIRYVVCKKEGTTENKELKVVIP